MAAGRLQASHDPVHARSQQTPSMQTWFAHSVDELHDAPLGRPTQVAVALEQTGVAPEHGVLVPVVQAPLVPLQKVAPIAGPTGDPQVAGRHCTVLPG
jgi:hypothetical protein